MRRYCLVPLLALWLCVVHAPSSGAAEPEFTRHYDLAAAPLDRALRDFALQTHCNLSYDPARLSGQWSPALAGDFTARAALARLLEGTGLRAVYVDEDTIEILAQATVAVGEGAAAGDRGGSSAGDRGSTLPIRYAIADMQASGPPATPSDTLASSDQPYGHGDADLSEVVVTGTHIRGVENKTVPLMTFDRDAIERSGYSTTQDFITSLPQNIKSGGNSADGTLGGQGLTNVENSTAANLRGLGSNSTLTLLNGHRLAAASYGTGVDLSMIPLNAIERIEVLTDGSSAVYGADAVGGVVNIQLRQDLNGAETSARLDTLARGGGEQKQLGQSFGKTWATGGALGVFQFDDSNVIRADQRSFTTSLPQPSDIYPASTRYSGILSGHQALPGGLEAVLDALLEHDGTSRDYTTDGRVPQLEQLKASTDSQSVNTGLRWQPFGDWRIEGDALFSQLYTLSRINFMPAEAGYVNGDPFLRNLSTVKEVDLKLDGTLWSGGGVSVKAAAGGSYRREDFSSLLPYLEDDRPLHRHVSSGFGEIYAPLVSSANAVPFIKALEISAAARIDSYSDFGSRTNPRVGIFWSPVEQVGVRASFSTSFRAPNPLETVSALTSNAVFVESGFALPGGTTGNVLFFGNQRLDPETSHNLTIGADYRPAGLGDTRFSINYYRINYANRITNISDPADVFVNPQTYGPLVTTFANDAAAQAFVNALPPPQTLYDLTSSQTGLAGVRYAFPYGYVNASSEHTDGLDLGGESKIALTGAQHLSVGLNATYIRQLATAYCNSCSAAELVNTYGQPLKWRALAHAGWSNRAWSTNAAVHFTGSYTDTNILPTGRIGSFTTVDLVGNYRLPIHPVITFGLSLLNVGNVGPPRTAPALYPLYYDPTNADARGRIISVLVRAQW